MKILQLIIESPTEDVVRTISFSENGISFIYGNIQEPKNLGATINSLGKTLLIKMIDYIFGANEDPSIMKLEIKNYILKATVKHINKIFKVQRTIGESKRIIIEGEKKTFTLTEYKSFFNIERGLYDKQLIIKKKASKLSQHVQKPGKSDFSHIFKLLELCNLISYVVEIYDSQDKIKEYKKSRKELISYYGNIEEKQIDEEIYFVDEEIKRLSSELNCLSTKIKNIEISKSQENIIEEFSLKSNTLKEIKSKIERNKLEHNRLEKFIESSNKSDIKSEHILAIYEKTKQEIPEMAKRAFVDVEKFHKTVYEERKAFLTDNIKELKKSIDILESELLEMEKEVDKLGKIISLNQVYQESLAIYEKYNTDLQNLKFREGKLSQVKNIDLKVKKEDNKLSINFQKSNEILKEYDDVTKKYREYISELTKCIYNIDVSAYFSIEIIKKHAKNRPVKIELTMRGDNGEGVGEVINSLIDYLIFRFNTIIEILVQDSACFNGIDPRQVSNMIQQITEIAKITDKQAIISINKYQLGEYSDSVKFVVQNSSIILSENDKLMKFDF